MNLKYLKNSEMVNKTIKRRSGKLVKDLDKKIISNKIKEDLNVSEEEKNEVLEFFENIKGQNDKNNTIFRHKETRINKTGKNVGKEKCFVRTFYTKSDSMYKNIDSICGNRNWFFSLQSFYHLENKGNIKVTNKSGGKSFVNDSENILTSLNVIAVDIDMQDNEGKEFINKDYIVNKLKENNLPCTVVVFSGHGYHIYFNIENVLFTCMADEINARDSLTNIANRLYCLFDSFDIKVDKSVTGDCSRILRVPYSYNKKDGKAAVKSEIVYKDYSVKYNLSLLEIELQNIIKDDQLEDTSTDTTNTVHTKGQGHLSLEDYEVIENGFEVPNENLRIREKIGQDFEDIFLERMQDIKMFIAKKRTYTGRRDRILYVVGNMIAHQNHFNKFKYSIKDELLQINNLFSEPLNDCDVEKIIKQCEEKEFKEYERKLCITNNKLACLLGLTDIDMTYASQIKTPEEQKRRNDLRVKERNAREKAERAANGKRVNKNQENYNNLMKCINAGITSNKAIADNLGVSEKTIARWKTKFGIK